MADKHGRGAPKGNKNATRSREWEQALKRALARRTEGDFRQGLDLLADKLINLAFDSPEDLRWTLEHMAERIDGKPVQSLDVSGEVNHRDVSELSDAELADIVRGRSSGDAEATRGETEPSPVH